jgi:hypothetical protein
MSSAEIVEFDAMTMLEMGFCTEGTVKCEKPGDPEEMVNRNDLSSNEGFKIL